jgi:biopolymer transport protein ExbD
MKYSSRDFGQPVEVDWTPMIDMTFQLIAFFMFTLSFADAEVNERITLPGSELAKPPDAPLVKPLTLQLTKDDTVLFAGDEVPVDGLTPYLVQERDYLVRTNHAPADATVIIRADALAKTGQVQELIQVCQETGFEKFVLRAKEER